MLDAIKIALTSVALLSSTTIAGFTVTRSSLFGFEVQDPTRAHVLELDEAAEILTRASRLAAVAPVASVSPADLLEAPRETWPGSSIYTETWRRGPSAESRIRKLRQALTNVSYRSGERTHRLSAELGADRETIHVVEVTYSAPKGARVPALGSEEGR